MYCFLEEVEMRTTKCPANSCIYKGMDGECLGNSRELYPDEIQKIKGGTLRVVKEKVAVAKERITLGVLIYSYLEYIKDTYQKFQSVNRLENTKLASVLQTQFGLDERLHRVFWDSKVFNKWKPESARKITIQDIETLLNSLIKVNHGNQISG